MSPVKDTSAMIAGMQPQLRDGLWVFRTFSDPAEALPVMANALASFVEDEGLSLILPLGGDDVRSDDHPMRCITLHVHSALDGIGLTAAVAEALTRAGIPCNMVAAFHHDHVFVPADQAETALETLIDRARVEQQS